LLSSDTYVYAKDIAANQAAVICLIIMMMTKMMVRIIITSGQSNLTQGRIAESYSPDGAIVYPVYRKPKMVAVATSLRCRVSAISAFCQPTTQTPSITNCLVAISFT